jgi:hypothetical protein
MLLMSLSSLPKSTRKTLGGTCATCDTMAKSRKGLLHKLFCTSPAEL